MGMLMIVPVTLAALICCAGSATAAVGWTIVPTPNPRGVTQASLYVVSCTSASNCMAVGDVYNPPAGPPALAEHWNGSTWTIQHTAKFDGTYPALRDVSCAGPASCMGTIAGGVTEHWNGSTWAVEKLIKPTANGSPLSMTPVSCAAPASCVVVGSYSINTKCRVVTERWNGSAWAVLAVFPGGCVAVGYAGLQAISCPTVSSCLAVGYGVAEYWNGATWAAEPPASPGGTATAFLSRVSCTGPASCTAVGFYNTATGTATLAESWNGSTWAIQATPTPAGTTAADLSGVSCPAPATPCTAVGSYATATTNYRTLAEVSPPA